MKISTKFLKWGTEKFKGYIQWAFVPLGTTFLFTTKTISKIDNKTNMTYCSKALYLLLNNGKVLIQWDFGTLSPTLTYTNSNFNNLSNCLEANQFIDCYRCNKKNLIPPPQPSSSLQGKKIRLSSLDTAHWQFAITSKDNFQYQCTLIQ